MKKISLYLLTVLILIFLTGCFSTPDTTVRGTIVKIKEDAKMETYMYFGIGIIQMNKSDNSVKVIDSMNVGAYLNKTQMGVESGLGITQDTRTLINKDADVRVEVKKSLKGLEVEINKGVSSK